MNWILPILATGLLGLAAFGDLRSRRIPNEVSLAVASLGLARLVVAGDVAGATRTLVAAVLVLAVTLFLFWRGWFGGGDAKLLSAAVLVVGYRDLLDFLFLTSLIGGLLVPAILARSGFSRFARAGASEGDRPCAAAPTAPSVPYGVAIAAACVAVVFLQAIVKR
jgi:prepilin peptidase CpaA